MAAYTYSIANDFPNHWVCPETLENEIRASSIESVYLYCVIIGDDCVLHFSATLSSADEDTLDAIVAAHTGQPPVSGPTEVSLVGGDSDAGVARVAVQSAAIPASGTEFALAIGSELSHGQSVETVSDALPANSTLHLLFARATCRPMKDSSDEPNILLVELIYREVVDEEAYDHLVGKTYLSEQCSADFPASTMAVDGTVMVGDGESTFFVIRRTIFGTLDDQDTFVVVRGYTE